MLVVYGSKVDSTVIVQFDNALQHHLQAKLAEYNFGISANLRQNDEKADLTPQIPYIFGGTFKTTWALRPGWKGWIKGSQQRCFSDKETAVLNSPG